MKYGALVLGLLLGWQTVDAKTILISDIDDTIKNSHILDRSETGGNALSTKNLFLGMNHAYELLKRQYGEEIQFFYVSNAPEIVFGSMESYKRIGIGPIHRKFAKEHGFPDATKESAFYFRDLSLPENHKVESIKKIVDPQSKEIDRVIFVGDNGEKDVFVYQEASAYIRAKYPHIKVSTHIRMGYWTQSTEELGKSTLEDQIGYATPLDLVLQWTSEGVLDANKVISRAQSQNNSGSQKLDPSESVGKFISVFANNLNAEKPNKEDGKLIFPEWVDCRDVTFDADLLLNVPTESIELASKTLNKVIKRCSIPGSENKSGFWGYF